MLAVSLQTMAMYAGAFALGRTRDSLTFVGTVTDAGTQDPIVGAVVFHDALYAASTDMSGRMSYCRARDRRMIVSIVATGYAPFDTTIRFSNPVDTVALPVSLRREHLLALEAGARDSTAHALAMVVGRALDAVTGAAVEGVRIGMSLREEPSFTDRSGVFGCMVGDSDVTFTFSHPDFRDTSVSVTAQSAGKLTEALVRLSPRIHPTDTTGTVVGRVVRAGDGTPVPGASAMLSGTLYSGVTDSAGAFVFEYVSPGTYATLVSAWGLESHGDALTVTVVEKDTVRCDIQMFEREAGFDATETPSTLIVSVIDRGRPATDSALVVLLPDSLWSALDSSGTARFDSLAAGTFSVAAVLRGTDTLRQQNVDLMAGEERTITLELLQTVQPGGTGDMTAAIVEGLVVDATEQTPMPGVRVQVPTARSQAVTDMQGRFSVPLRRGGRHTIVVAHKGYTTVTDTLETERGTVTRFDVLLMTSNVSSMSRMVIRGVAVRNTGASVLAKRQAAINVSDNLSVEDMSRAGASNAADAIKAIPGVTLIEGKYPIIRGLGDRYIVSLMNGMRLPSPNPDRPVITFDLFPTALLDNVTMHKTYTPDMWGDFSAGTVELNLRSLPDSLTGSVSAGIGANDATTLRDDFLAYEGGSTDWLGIDDGTRALPEVLEGDDVWTPSYYDPLLAASNPDSALDIISRLDAVAKSFGDAPLVGEETTARPNQSYSGTVGGTIGIGEARLGLLASLAYSNSLKSRADELESVWYLGVHDSLADSLTLDRQFKSQTSAEEILWGALLNVGLKIKDGHTLSGMYTYTRASEDEVRKLTSTHYLQIEDPDVHLVHNELRYVERGLHFGHLAGEHLLPFGEKTKVEWKGAIADGSQNEPDYRVSTMVVEHRDEDTLYSIRRSLGSTPSHRYRYTRETSGDLRVDMTVPYRQWTRTEGFIKGGIGWQSKKREFWQRRLRLDTHSPPSTDLDTLGGDLNAFVAVDNMGLLGVDTARTAGAVRVADSFYTIGNIYLWDAEADTSASHTGIVNPQISLERWSAYLMAKLPLAERFELVGGIRYQPMYVRMQSQKKDDPSFNGEFRKDFWPFSLSLKIVVTDDMAVRLAYGKTFAMPIFREMAPFASYDPAHGDWYVGNANLKYTSVDNVDLRWEWFVKPGEVVSVGGYYKYLYRPVVVAAIPGGSNNEKTWVNATEGQLYGIEVEARKELSFLHKAFRGLWVGGNLTLTHSGVTLDSLKEALLKENTSAPDLEPPLIDASPYVINAYLMYDNEPLGLSAGVFFNMFGKRRVFQTGDFTPDVYENPRPELNLSCAKTIEQFRVKLSAKNLLDPSHAKGHQYKDGMFQRSSYRKGRTYSVSLSYSL